MKITLYPDQEDVLARLRQSLKRNRSVLLQAATGSGKTVIASKMVFEAHARGKRSIFNVPRRDLLKQTSETFSKYDIPHSFISAGKPYDPFALVYISTTETLANRLENAPRDISLFIPDETHFGAESLGACINHYRGLGSYIVGPSATPQKMNGQGMNQWYDDMVCGKSVKWLIENKRLSEFKYFEGKTKEDFHALQKKTDKEISAFMESKRVIIGDCVADYKKRCVGKLHIVRCTSILHSQITANAFREAGILAYHVDGTTPDDEKLRIFTAFAKREIAVITFADLLSFGWDLSSYTGLDVCVESASDLKPCKSLPAQMQFWGRSLRYKPFPAIFNDHVNNHIEHGLPWSDREWSLEATKKKGGGTPPTRQCPECWFVHTPTALCPNCGYEYEVSDRGVDHAEGELHEVDIHAERYNKKKEQAEAKTLEDLIKVGKLRGYKHPAAWATKIIAARVKKRLAEG